MQREEDNNSGLTMTRMSTVVKVLTISIEMMVVRTICRTVWTCPSQKETLDHSATRTDLVNINAMAKMGDKRDRSKR
jgi:hypothetical protein